MAQPADEKRDYTFTYRAEGGGEAVPGVFTYMTVMRVHGPTGRATMVLNRHNGDLIGKPVGLFGTQLTPSQTLDIASAIEGTKWAELPQPAKGDINAPMLAIDYAHGLRIIQRSFNARNLEFIRSIEPVMSRVDELGSTLLTKPQRALDIALQRTSGGFKVVFRNVGTGPIIVADPRRAAGAPGADRVVVNVAEEIEQTPGAFALPPVWKPVALQPLGSAPASVTIAPGRAHEVETVAWAPPASGGKFVAQAIWTDYVGPVVDPSSVMPMVPDPQENDERPYVVRGAAFSSFLKFAVERKK